MDPRQNTFNNFANLPPHSNPPPQIFGNYAPDGTLVPVGLNSSLFNAEQFDFGDFEYPDGDQLDPKRRRIARACDVCRKKKIKCDGKQPCLHCQGSKAECVFTFTEKKRAQPKGAKYIEGLENRLHRMEHLLRLSGLLGENEVSQTDLGLLEQRLSDRARSARNSGSPMSDHRKSMVESMTGRSRSAGGTPPQRELTPSPKEEADTGKDLKEMSKNMFADDLKQCREMAEEGDKASVDNLAEMMDSLITNNQGETRYIGSSSGVSIFSPKGIKWVTEKTGDASFAQMFASAAPETWYHWRPEVFGDIFARRTYTDLPPKELCLELLGEFFEHFNSMLPIFHEPTFTHLVDMQYSDTPYGGSGWWACLNVALSLACRMRAMNFGSGINAQQDSAAWAYFKNALAVVPELILKNTDLFSVQALIAMCIFLQGTPNPQPSFALIGAAIRSAQSIGLHKRGQGYGFNAVEIEQRKRVFWVAYLVDKDVCLRSGRPPAQEFSDWNVELPSENPDDGMGNVLLADGKTNVNIFRKMCEFAVISGEVFQNLYSVNASKQTDGELLNAVNNLDLQLEAWKESIPIDLRPEHEIKSPNPGIIVNTAVLHFAYYNCVSTIHRRSIMQGIWSSRLAEYAVEGRNATALNHRVFQSAALSVAAARLSISLLKYIPQGDYSLVWLIIYYPVSALITIFGNLLMRPSDPRARSDLELMNMVVTFLQKVTAEEKTGSTRRMYDICRAFEGIARNAIEKAERDMNTRQKRKHEKDQKKYGSVDLGTANPTTGTSLNTNPPRMSTSGSASSTGHTPLNPSSNTFSPRSATSSNTFNFLPDTSNFQSQPLFENMPSNTQTFNPNMIGDQSLLNNGGNTFAGLQHAYSQDFDPLPGLSFMAGAGSAGNENVIPQTHSDMNLGGYTGYDESHRHSDPGLVDGGRMSSGGPTVINGGAGPMLGGASGMDMNWDSNAFVPQDLWSMPMTFEWDWNGVGDFGV